MEPEAEAEANTLEPPVVVMQGRWVDNRIGSRKWVDHMTRWLRARGSEEVVYVYRWESNYLEVNRRKKMTTTKMTKQRQKLIPSNLL